MNKRRAKSKVHKVRGENVLRGTMQGSLGVFEDPHVVFASARDFNANRAHRQGCSSRRTGQLLRVTDYAQLDKIPWTDWNGRWVNYSEVRRRFHLGEIEAITRKAYREAPGKVGRLKPGSEGPAYCVPTVVTFFKEKFAVRPGEPTIGLLKVKSAIAYASCRDQDFDEDMRQEAERVIAYPFEGPNPALTFYPAIGEREVKEALNLYSATEREYCSCEACKTAVKVAA